MRFIFLFFIPILVLVFSLWNSTVFGDKFSNTGSVFRWSAMRLHFDLFVYVADDNQIRWTATLMVTRLVVYVQRDSVMLLNLLLNLILPAGALKSIAMHPGLF